jgi:hypothetical protein
MLGNIEQALSNQEFDTLQAQEHDVTKDFKDAVEQVTMVQSTGEIAGELAARNAATLVVNDDDASLASMELSIEGKSDPAPSSRQLLKDPFDVNNEPTPSTWFRTLPDIAQPDSDGCTLSCSSSTPVCGQDGTCVVKKRECVKLCTHTEVNTILQPRTFGEVARYGRLKAECTLSKLVTCSATADDPKEQCNWITRSRCNRLQVLWQERQATMSNWERNDKGEPNYVTVPAEGVVRCPPVGIHADHCSGFTALG